MALTYWAQDGDKKENIFLVSCRISFHYFSAKMGTKQGKYRYQTHETYHTLNVNILRTVKKHEFYSRILNIYKISGFECRNHV